MNRNTKLTILRGGPPSSRSITKAEARSLKGMTEAEIEEAYASDQVVRKRMLLHVWDVECLISVLATQCLDNGVSRS